MLSSYQPIAYDPYCGEPVAWGYKIVKPLPAKEFQELRKISTVEYIDCWCVLIRTLTRRRAITLYGEVTTEEFGPKGDWQCTTFGEKIFVSKYFCPED